MRMKRCVAGVVVLLCVGRAEAGFLESLAISLAENKAIEQAPDCTLSADEAYARSIELLSDGRQAEAEDLIKSAVKTYRDDIRILFAKAVLDRSRWRKASANVWFTMTGNAQGNETLSQAAGLSIKLDQKRSVEKTLDQLIRLSDENPDEICLLWLTAIHCRQETRNRPHPLTMHRKFVKQGRQRYEKLLEKFSIGPVMVHQTYANLLTEDSKEYEKALEHRMLAISMTSGDWALQGLGNTLIMMEKYEWANAVWARTVRQCPSDAEYWNRWGFTLFSLSRYDEAIEKCREAVRLRPQNKTYRRDLNWFLNIISQIEEGSKSFAMYQQAVQSGDKLALSDLADCYRWGRGVKENHAKAIELYKYAIEQGDKSALSGLAHCHYHGVGVEKNHAKGIELYKRYIENFPNSEKELQILGDHYFFRRGGENHPKAVEYFEAVLKVNPDNIDVWFRFMKILMNSGDATMLDYPRAVKMAEQELEKEEHLDTIEILADAYLKNKQYNEAVQMMERLIDRLKERKKRPSFFDEKMEKLERYKKIRQQAEESS